VRQEQLEFFGLFQLVSFPKPISFPAPWRNSPLCGSYLDLQESEILILLKDPTLSLEQVIDLARPDAITGLSRGMDLANDTVLRDIARSGRAISTVQLNRAAASMIHAFPLDPKERVPKPGDYTMTAPEHAELIKPQLAAGWTQQLRFKGDKDLVAPDMVAAQLAEESFRRVMANYNVSGADPFRAMLAQMLGLDLSRLPAGATKDDFVHETLFGSRMALHERRMSLPAGAAYKAITQQMLPSMVAWFALDRVAKSNDQRADGSNMIDFPLAALVSPLHR